MTYFNLLRGIGTIDWHTGIPIAERIPFARRETQARDLWSSLLERLAAWGVEPSVRVVDDAGQPVWGVEWGNEGQPATPLPHYLSI